MKTVLIILVSLFCAVKLNAQDVSEKKSPQENLDNPENTMRQSIDVGVTKVEYYKSNGKHYIKVTYKNFGSSPVLNVQLKYKINNKPWVTMNTIPGSIGAGQIRIDPKIPFNNVGFTVSDGIIVGQINLFQVCTVWNDANNSNNCKTLPVSVL